VLSIYPEVATDEPDPMKRLSGIRASMNMEKQRSVLEKELLNVWDWPYGARDRRAASSDASQIEAAIGPASAVLSNVPGPAERLIFTRLCPGRQLSRADRRAGPDPQHRVAAKRPSWSRAYG